MHRLGPLSDEEIRKILANSNAIHTNSHFVGVSGKHLDTYIAKDNLGMSPGTLSILAHELVCRFLDNRRDYNIAQAVVGAPMGAITFGSFIAMWWNELAGSELKFLYAEKTGDADDAPFKIRPAFAEVIRGKKVIAAEDILNQGGSALKTLAAIREAGGEPVAVLAQCNRGGVTAEKLGVPIVSSLMNVSLAAYDEKDCPMCKQGIPVRTDLGHGKKFLERKASEQASDQPDQKGFGPNVSS
jgi:orotate phosphoribosyltransferase